MLKIGGIKQNKSTPLKTAFSAQSDGEEEEEEDVLSRKNNKKPIAKTRVNAAPLSRVARDTIQAARQQDASVFEYDAVFDSMKAGQREIEEQRKLESKERKVEASSVYNQHSSYRGTATLCRGITKDGGAKKARPR